MTTTINADNGVVSGSAGLKETPDSSGILALQTNGVTAVTIDGSQNATFAGTLKVNGSTTSLYPLVSGTAVTASGTSIDFTGVPSWAKRVTVMFSGVSTSGTSNVQIQIGDNGGVENTGYSSGVAQLQNAAAVVAATAATGFLATASTSATSTFNGNIIFNLVSANAWTANGTLFNALGNVHCSAASKTLSDVLDRVRITTVNGTDTFDAGTINILWE